MVTNAAAIVSVVLAAAQSTGSMSPTSDMSLARVRPEGITTTSTTMADVAGAAVTASPMWDSPKASGFPARGARVARAVGLRSILKSRGDYGALSGVMPSGVRAYNALWIRDFYMMARPYPGYFSADYLRPIVDAFVDSIGGEVLFPDFPAERIEPDGSYTYWPGAVGGGYGHYPVFDSAPYLALLVVMTHDRGDLTVFSTHRAKIERALQAAPRNASGLLYSDPADYSVDWGFQDTCRPPGGVGMGTALHALAYRKLEKVALAVGNPSAAARYRSRANALIVALRTLRRTDGFYKPSSGLDRRHAALTALIVSERLCSDGEAVTSAHALLSEYRAGNLTERGAMRFLVKPDYFTSGIEDGYQNGGYWLGEWLGWLARSFELVGAGDAARKVVQDGVDEILREHRVDAMAPWEWSFASDRGVLLYNAATAFLADVYEASPDYIDVTLGGASGSTRLVPLPAGSEIVGAEVWVGVATTATVSIYGAARSAAVSDAPGAPPLTFGNESTVLTVSLANESGASALSGSYPAGVFGGYARLVVTSGSASSDFTVRLVTSSPAASWIEAAGAPFFDEFGSDSSASYTTSGTWSVSAGRLHNTDETDGQVWLLSSVVSADMAVSTVVNSANLNTRYPCLALRAADADNMTFVLVGTSGSTDVIRVYDRVSGVNTQRGADISVTLVNDADYSVMAEIFGETVRVTFNGTAYLRTTGRTGTGRGGVRLGVAGVGETAEVQFDNLTVTPYDPFQPVPPGMVQESASSAQVTGETYPIDSSGGLRDEFGRLMSPTPAYIHPVIRY